MNAGIQEVVERFEQTQQKNQALYEYVSELNSEAEHLAEEIKDIEEKIERHKVYGVGNASPGDF